MKWVVLKYNVVVLSSNVTLIITITYIYVQNHFNTIINEMSDTALEMLSYCVSKVTDSIQIRIFKLLSTYIHFMTQ